LIPVERAKVGMVLAMGVTDRRGRLLIPAGNDLSEKYLECLLMWGVTHVEVEGDGPGDQGENIEVAEPWAVSRAMEMVDKHFLLANRSHPVMKELSAICVQRKAREIQKEGQP
jgi:hypothetical protein